MRKKQRKRKKRFSFFIILIFLFLGTFLAAFLGLHVIEKSFLPPLREISHIQCKTLANQMIDKAVADMLQEMDFSASSLLLKGTDGESYTADTSLVNQFCSLLSAEITASLMELPKEVIRIPMGAATNTTFFANMGPKIPFTLLPMGAVKVDYETSFRSVGINQINYKIWLQISIDLKIVNPLYQETLTMERKIMLADLIFSGKVPEHYFQMTPRDEYLLTE